MILGDVIIRPVLHEIMHAMRTCMGSLAAFGSGYWPRQKSALGHGKDTHFALMEGLRRGGMHAVRYSKDGHRFFRLYHIATRALGCLMSIVLGGMYP